MLRIVAGRLGSVVRSNTVPRSTAVAAQNVRQSHDGPQETEEEFNSRHAKYLDRPNIDAWEIRSVMNNLAGMDLVPDPVIICAAMRACRRVNDYALAIRIQEMVKEKCAPNMKEIYPYILQEIKPTLEELGIETIEELGYDKPELALVSPYDIH